MDAAAPTKGYVVTLGGFAAYEPRFEGSRRSTFGYIPCSIFATPPTRNG